MQTLAHRRERRCGHRRQKRLHPALKVEVVVDFLDGLVIGEAVLEPEYPETRLDAVGNRDLLRDIGPVSLPELLRERRGRGQCGEKSERDELLFRVHKLLLPSGESSSAFLEVRIPSAAVRMNPG